MGRGDDTWYVSFGWKVPADERDKLIKFKTYNPHESRQAAKSRMSRILSRSGVPARQCRKVLRDISRYNGSCSHYSNKYSWEFQKRIEQLN